MILLIIFLIFIIIFTILGIIWSNRTNTSSKINFSISDFPISNFWSQPQPSSNENKNTCQLYTFPVDENNGTIYLPTPTLNSNILNSLTGTINLPTCIDSDQLVAQQVQHVCRQYDNNSNTQCRLLTGGTTGVNGVETYYSNCNDPVIPQCVGNLSLISTNYHPLTADNIYCLTANGTNTLMSICDPTNENSLFRVTRTNIDTNPNTLVPNSPQTGILAQIYNRNNGLCLNKSNNITTSVYNPSFSNSILCNGPNEFITGTGLFFDNCDNLGRYNGYAWLFLPSMSYCSNPDGCQIFDITPPQIVYSANLDLSTFPGFNSSFRGFTGTSATVTWLLFNNAQSLYFGGGNDTIILQPYRTRSNQCDDQPYFSQYLNLATYNTMSKIPVCTVNSIVNCIDL